MAGVKGLLPAPTPRT